MSLVRVNPSLRGLRLNSSARKPAAVVNTVSITVSVPVVMRASARKEPARTMAHEVTIIHYILSAAS